jgi:hypothetical protein
LDGQQTKIVLYDLGVNNLSDLWFAFDSENVTEFLPSCKFTILYVLFVV